MIKEYHRPETIEEALKLLSHSGRCGSILPAGISPEVLFRVFPLGGGTILNRPSQQEFAVVDLQRLGLDGIEQRGNQFVLGATLTLERFLNMVEGGSEVQDKGVGVEYNYPKDLGSAMALASAIRLETTYNLRQAATLAGRLVAATGRSTLATALLALDVDLTWTSERLYPDEEKVSLGEFLLSRDRDWSGKLITQVNLPVNARLAFERVARTPADTPIVCAAVAIWPSGRWRVTLGGYGSAPRLALDGFGRVLPFGGSAEEYFRAEDVEENFRSEAVPSPGIEMDASGIELAIRGGELAARSAYLLAGDEWASAEYRSEMAGVLVKRCLRRLL